MDAVFSLLRTPIIEKAAQGRQTSLDHDKAVTGMKDRHFMFTKLFHQASFYFIVSSICMGRAHQNIIKFN